MVYTDILRQRAKKNTTVKALKKLSPYDIILSPVLTEKAYGFSEGDAKDQQKKYFFKIHQDATKTDVKSAITMIYGIVPVSVNVAWVKEKGRANRKLVRKSYKKAVVTVPAGQKLPVMDV